MIVHEPAFTEAREAEDFPAADPITTEDIGHHDNVEDDVVLPQIENQLVSSPVLTNNELISIGCPLTPIAQDASWADHPQHQDTPSAPQPQDDDDFEAQPTPSPQASPAFRRLRKVSRPQVPPTVHVSESEAKTAEDIPAASADEEEEPRVEVERVATTPATDQVILEENVIAPVPPVIEETEVENTKATTKNTTDANDVVMAEANVAPTVNTMHEATDAPTTNV